MSAAGCATGHPAAKTSPRLSVGEVLRAFWPEYEACHRPGSHYRQVAHALMACGTEQLGYTLWGCRDCGAQHWTPNGCGNRHCPSCQHRAAANWLHRQQQVLLPVSYFHLVFTLPHLLQPWVRTNPVALYRLLFDAASATLLTFGRQSFQAELGITAVLHTWGQRLTEHPHLHCLVTGGGLDGQNQWQGPVSDQYLFPVQALSAMFQGKFIAGLQQLFQRQQVILPKEFIGPSDPAALTRWWQTLRQQKWVVFSKRPFSGPEQVLKYISLYTHRVAISNGRLVALDPAARTVTFRYRDYADAHQLKSMTLDGVEFTRRFLQHVLPIGFTKIRHYGLLGNNRRSTAIPLARAALEKLGAKPVAAPAPTPNASQTALKCPGCGSQRLRVLERVDKHGHFFTADPRMRLAAPTPSFHDSS